MAYIEWWNRTGPVTLGERFGLNEISTARNTLSPIKSYTDGGRIALGDGSITYTAKGEHKGKYHLRLGGGEDRTTHRGTKTELEKILKQWKITNPPGVNIGKQIIKGNPKRLKAIIDDIPKMSNSEVVKKHNVSRTTLWEIMQDNPKLEFGKKEFNPFYGPRLDPEVTTRLNKLQEIIKNTKIPEGQIKASDDIVKTLAKKMGISSEKFLGSLSQLRQEYGNPTGRIEIIESVKKNLGRFPDPKFIREHLRVVGYSEKTTATLNAVERAAKVVANSKTNLEHSLPRNLIKFFKLPKKYLLMGERTSNFLNQFKKQFDNKLLLAAKEHAKGNLTYNEYKKAVDAIRDTVRKATGGYEIGYVDFKDGKPVGVTSQKSILKGTDVVGKKTTGLINFFKNSQYHNNLYNNWMKDKNNKIFTTLNEEVEKMKKHKIKFLPEKELEETYNAIKNFKNKEQFMTFYKKYPTSPFFRALTKAASMTGGKGKLILGGAATFSVLSTALSAEELEPDDKKQEAGVTDTGWTKGEIASGITLGAIGTAAANRAKTVELAKKAGKKILSAGEKVIRPLFVPAVDLAIHQDPSDPFFWMSKAFWANAMDKYGITRTYSMLKNTPDFKGKSKILRDIALRGVVLNPKAVRAVSKIGWPMTAYAAMAEYRGKPFAETSKKAEELGIDVSQYVDRSGGTIDFTDELYAEIAKRESGQGMDYAQGGIASLIK